MSWGNSFRAVYDHMMNFPNEVSLNGFLFSLFAFNKRKENLELGELQLPPFFELIFS